MELLVKCIEAVREKRSSKEHDGLATVLRETSARALHADAGDRLGGCLGDPRAYWVFWFRGFEVLHTTGGVLIVDVRDGALELRASRCGEDRREPRTHASKDALCSALLLLDRLAPRGGEDLRIAGADALDGIGGLLHVLGDVEGIDELHRVAPPVPGQTRLHRVKRAPLRLGTVAPEYDIERGALSQHA